LNALTNSLEAQLSTPAEAPNTVTTTVETPTAVDEPVLTASTKLTDGFFVFEDTSTPLYTYRAPNMRNK